MNADENIPKEIHQWEFTSGLIDNNEQKNYLGISDDSFLNYLVSKRINENEIQDGFISSVEKCSFNGRNLALIRYMNEHFSEYSSYWTEIENANPSRIPKTPDAVEYYIEKNSLEKEFGSFYFCFTTMLNAMDEDEIRNEIIYSQTVSLFKKYGCSYIYIYRIPDYRGIFIPEEWISSYEKRFE